jgi:hypothetical protein
VELLASIGNPSHIVPQIPVTENLLISKYKGHDLFWYLARQKTFPLSTFATVLAQMKLAHEANIIFGDRKAENILIGKADEEAYFIDLDNMEQMGNFKEEEDFFVTDLHAPSALLEALKRKAFFREKQPYLDQLNRYGKVNDDYAMLITLIRASDSFAPTKYVNHTFEANGRQISFEKEEMPKVFRDNWIRRNARSPEDAEDLILLLDDTRAYHEKHGNNKHLVDMLHLSRTDPANRTP